MRPVPDKPIRFGMHAPSGEQLKYQLINLPKKVYAGASRYDTDNEVKLHLWDEQGNSYDLVIPK